MNSQLNEYIKQIHATEKADAVQKVAKALDGKTLTNISRYFDKPTKDWMKRHDIVVAWQDNYYNIIYHGSIDGMTRKVEILKDSVVIGIMDTVACTEAPIRIKVTENGLSANMKFERFYSKARWGDPASVRSGIVFQLEQY